MLGKEETQETDERPLNIKKRLEEEETGLIVATLYKKEFCSVSCMKRSRSSEVKSSSEFSKSFTAPFTTIIIISCTCAHAATPRATWTDTNVRGGSGGRLDLRSRPHFKLYRWVLCWRWRGNQVFFSMRTDFMRANHINAFWIISSDYHACADTA